MLIHTLDLPQLLYGCVSLDKPVGGSLEFWQVLELKKLLIQPSLTIYNQYSTLVFFTHLVFVLFVIQLVISIVINCAARRCCTPPPRVSAEVFYSET